MGLVPMKAAWKSAIEDCLALFVVMVFGTPLMPRSCVGSWDIQ
jgi:hypothetical protein